MPKSVSLDKDGTSPKESAVEVWNLVRDYAKQETVDPLKGLVGYVKWGLIGALLVGIGAIEVIIAVMRLAQAEGSEVFDGGWSFVPYVFGLVAAGVALILVKKGATSKRPPTS